MKPNLINISQINIPEIETKKEGKLYFLSKSYETGTGRSKDVEIVNASCFDRTNLDSSIFWSKFKESKKIIIIDKFFEIEDINKTVKAIKENNMDKKDFEIFELYTEKFTEKKDALKEIKRLLKDKFIIYNLNEKFVHDRFAILDDELFHFGCTVGGKTKEGFSAFSCGWSADKIKILIKEVGNKYSERITSW